MTEPGKGPCRSCGKECENHLCSWDCRVEEARKNGAVQHTPNGLPVRCITAENLLLEHPHGNHRDYKFPVDVEYVGPPGPAREDFENLFGRPPESDKEALDSWRETHALIYTDGCVAVTMDEYCYAMWYVSDGSNGGGSLWKNRGHWRLSAASLEKIKALRG